METQLSGGITHRGRQRSALLDGLVAVILCVAFGVLVGRLTSTSVRVRPGFGTAKEPLRDNGAHGVRGPSIPTALRLAPERPAPKSYFLPEELGVHHYVVSGKLTDGTLVNFHFWLVMTRQLGTAGGNGNIQLQGYGMFQPVDIIVVNGGGMLEMPRGSADAIKEEGFLFLTQRSTGRQYNITVAVDKGSLRSPFHLTCTLPDDVAPSSMALDLHVRNWRRFVELPMEHMLAVSPDTARGRFRVGVWLTPEMTGPQAARLVALHAQYHVVVRGFDEEQVYMHPHQMAHCLQDAAVMELVEQGHLKLIYIDSAPEIFTSCKKVKRSGSFNSTVAADEQDCSEQVVKYGHQVLVNAQIMLANLGSDAYVLNVDLDEFLVTDNRTTLAEVFDRCAGNESADLPRTHALCTDCMERNVTEPDLWMHTESTQHPLAHYHTLLTPAAHGHKREQPKWMVKPDAIWSVNVHGARVLKGHKVVHHEDVLACGARLLHVYNMFVQRAPYKPGHTTGTVAYDWAIEDQQQLNDHPPPTQAAVRSQQGDQAAEGGSKHGSSIIRRALV